MESVRYRAFINLLSVHREIEAELRTLRLAVCAADAPGAEAASTRFGRRLLQHMGHEEEWLLPRYEELVPNPPAHGSAALIRRDHELIRARIEALPAQLRAWHQGTAAGWLAIADALHDLAELLDHHDQREADGLFVELDRCLPAVERRAWLDAIAADAGHLVPDEEAVPTGPAVVPTPTSAGGCAPEYGLCVALATSRLDEAWSEYRRQQDLTASLDGAQSSGGEPARRSAVGFAAKRRRQLEAVEGALRQADAQSDSRGRHLALLRAYGPARRAARLAAQIRLAYTQAAPSQSAHAQSPQEASITRGESS